MRRWIKEDHKSAKIVGGGLCAVTIDVVFVSVEGLAFGSLVAGFADAFSPGCPFSFLCLASRRLARRSLLCGSAVLANRPGGVRVISVEFVVGAGVSVTSICVVLDLA
ncbi:hypothetical protein L211DRAFT_452855 [Terfezia boudieri ATCC MYA-4762]|uniref:Uncharacterized protein n=1 Tax=Terfezia boudieri ATCC MYA-4762 TaxID=1051890 RepID=A0A3N4LHD4_9PEZI|nr:hypothetical protein L211DRAFT_452855 [Terfezia boudieri ATCC MYA-4762]